MSLHGFSYTICDFATNKTEKKYEVSQTFKKNTELSKSMTNFRPLSNGDTKKKKKITDWITSQNQFAEGIQLT
jgi:predicted transcriptional regulator